MDMNDKPVYDLMLVLKKLTRSTLMHQHVIAAKMNLNVTDAECIDFLLDSGPTTAGQLANITNLTTGAITSAIDRLERAGYVERYRDDSDRRKVMVKLRAIPESPAKEAYKQLAERIFILLSEYDNNELVFIAGFISRLTEIYESETLQGKKS